MGNIIRGGMVAVAVVALAGSAASKYKPFTPVERWTQAPIDKATAAAARILTDEGFTVASTVPGLVTTEWRTFGATVESQLGDAQNAPQGRWVVQITEGKIRIDLQCQHRDMSPCGNKRPPGDWQAKANQIADEVSMER